MKGTKVARALTIAGSDSGGGAGIQADLKAFARSGVHGMTAITAVTAQNTLEVRSVYEIPADLIEAQVRVVVEDIGVDAVKIGMLASEAVIDAVAAVLDVVGDVPTVLDPVMVAESGAQLLEPSAVDALVTRLIPKATVITPNLHEASILAAVDEHSTVEQRARAVLDLGPAAVVVTGGHGGESADDIYVDSDRVEWIMGERYESGAAHGSGCTHSALLTASMARGLSALEAARKAKEIASVAVRDGHSELGGGSGPVDAFAGTRAERAHRILPI